MYTFFRFQIECKEDGVNILHILGVEYDQSGEIQCIAYASNATSGNQYSTKESVFAELVVIPIGSSSNDLHSRIVEFDPISASALEHSSSSAASLTHKPDDTIVRCGDSVCLTARFIGWPISNVKWFRAVS